MRLALAAVLVAGCADSHSAVRGSYVYRYGDGTTVPVDLSRQSFQAYVLQDGGYVVYPHEPVAGTAGGTFEIPDVPDGPFLLRRSFGTFYGVFVPHDAHTVAETWDVLGRPDAAPVLGPTFVELDATGLAAWQADDSLSLDCFGNASELVDPALSPPLTAGATAIQATFDWGEGYSWGAGYVPYLMDATAGDELLIAHASARTSDGVRTSVVTQVLTAAAPAPALGEMPRVTGAFVDVAATLQLTAAVPGDQLAAMLETGITPVDQNVVLVVGPATATGSLLGPELTRMTTRAAAAPLLASAAYGNPFDPAWQPRIAAWYTARRHLDAGQLGTLDIPFAAFTESRSLAGDRFTLEPLTAVSQVTLDGVAVAGQSVRLPPHQAVRLDFVEPAEATRGRVIVWRVDRGVEAAYVELARAPIDLPPDLFQAGGRYAFQVDVFADDGDGRTRSASTYSDAITLLGQ